MKKYFSHKTAEQIATPVPTPERGKRPLSKVKLIAGAIILLIFALCFNAALTLSSMKKLYAEAVVSQYGNIGKDLQQHPGTSDKPVTALGEKPISSLNDRMFYRNLKRLGIIITCGAVLLIIFNLMILKADHLQKIPRKQLSVAIFSVILLSQIIFSGLNIYDFKSEVRGQESSGKENVAITIASISKEKVSSQLNEMILDSLTILVISVFFFVEILILFFQVIEKGLYKERSRNVHYSDIRPVFFLLLFGLYISISFVPLYMEKLYVPISGLSKEMVLSLPISVSVFSSGIGFFIAGVWNDRRGWHEPFFTGIFLAGMGLLYAWLAKDSFHFIISRAFSGMGYGIFFMASQGFIITYTDNRTKAHGFATLSAALYAGIICSSPTGAMLAERIGYGSVFFIGAMIIFSGFVYAIFFMRNAIRNPKSRLAEGSEEILDIKQIFHFLSDKNVFTLILFSSIPANMAMIGFLEYFNPIYLSRIGTSQSNIGRTFMLYCVFIIYIGPFISKYVDASENKKAYISAGGVLGSLAFMVFYFFEGILAVILAILFLGFSQSFVFVSQASYLLKMKITQELGEGKAIATFRLVSRLGQAAGPMLFGALIAAVDINKGVAYFGFAYLFITALLLFFIQTDRKLVTR